ncbi:MAG: hypothetical protein WBG80_00575 [Bacteroidota bacterium]
MKTLTSLVLTIVLSTSLLSQTKDGFKGYKWGTPVDKMKEEFALTLLTGDERDALYTSNVEKIGNADLFQCLFSFYKGRFSMITMVTLDSHSSKALLRIVQDAYGKAQLKDKSFHMWPNLFKDTEAKFGMVDDMATFLLFSKTFQRQQKLDEEEAAKRGKDEL